MERSMILDIADEYGYSPLEAIATLAEKLDDDTRTDADYLRDTFAAANEVLREAFGDEPLFDE